MFKRTPSRPNPRLFGIYLGVVLIAGCAGDDPKQLWVRANQALDQGKFDEVEADLKRIAKLRPVQPEDLMLTGQLQIARKQMDEAIATLNQIPESSPLSAMANFQVGQLELRQGRVRLAEQHYLASVKQEPSGTRPRRELVYIYGMQSRWKELAEQFRGLSKIASLTVDDVILWCLTRSVTWRPEEITDDLKRWSEADPEDRWSRLALAENLYRRQYGEEAEKVVATLPLDDPDVRAFIARITMERGDIARSAELLESGPADHAGLARLRGRLALNRHNGQEALRQFQIAFKHDPDHRDTLNGLAQAYLMLGKFEEAKPYQKLTRDYDALGSLIEKLAAKSIPRTSASFKQLGAAYETVGRVEEARAWYSLAIGLAPLDSQAQQALFRLNNRKDRSSPG